MGSDKISQYLLSKSSLPEDGYFHIGVMELFI